MCEMLRDLLTADRHTVDTTRNGCDGYLMLSTGDYELAVIDWDLPDMTGVQICKEFRAKRGRTPILMLTGKSASSEKVAGLDAGADDYLTKPFNFSELAARVRALLRRTGAGSGETILKAGGIELNPLNFTVTNNDRPVPLVGREFALLEFLLRHPNEIFSGEALIQRIWASDSDVTGDAVRTALKRLRRKLSETGDGDIIETVHGVGYRLRQSRV